MDVVPYAFCDDVCAVVKDLDALGELTLDISNCGIWNAAAVATAARRVTVDVYLICVNGVCSYRIRKTAKNEVIGITFQELKAINRCCVRTSAVGIGTWNGLENAHTSTVDELREILKYSAPFVNLAQLWISDDILAEELSLSLFYNSSFYEIRAVGYSKAAEHFLTVQLLSEGLKIIDIRDQGWSDELRESIERFALTKSFTNVDVNDSLVFGLKFLKKLLRTSCRHDWFTFTAHFGVKFRNLRKLKKEMQIETGDDKIAWRRPDGAEMEITRRWYDRRLFITLIGDN